MANYYAAVAGQNRLSLLTFRRVCTNNLFTPVDGSWREMHFVLINFIHGPIIGTGVGRLAIDFSRLYDTWPLI